MPAGENAFTTWGIITLVGGSSVFAAIVTQGVGWLRDWWKAKVNREFATVYLVAALERYANEASNAISDSENYDSSDGEIGRAVVNVPELTAYPDSIEWTALGPKTTKRMLAFQVEIEAIRSSIAFHWEVTGDEDFVIPDVREKTALVGLKALQLAAVLEAEYAGEPIDLGNQDWSVKAALQDGLTRYTDLRIAREAASAKMYEELNAALPSGAELTKAEVGG